MNNLFVCHSQAQLILACGLSLVRFKNDNNYLIVFVDFKISESLKEILKKIYFDVYFFQGTYPKEFKTWKSKIKRYPQDIENIKSFLRFKRFDRLFEVCDECIPELYILKKTFVTNPQIECAWLEDGSFPYFQNTLDLSGFSSNKYTKFIRKILLKYIAGFGHFYDFRGSFMGSNNLLKYAYLTFPGKQRDAYNSKMIIEITNEEFNKGLTSMFPPKKELILKNHSILIVLDKLDVYKNENKIKLVIKDILDSYSDKSIYYKYHPREESYLKELENCIEIPRYEGVENIYSSNVNKDICIIGIKSTSLQNAIKMGFKTISYAKKADEVDSNITNFYEKIGIEIK